MSDPLYGQCPYCGRAMGEDHKCWQKSAIGSLKGEFSDPDLLQAEVKRLTAELYASRKEHEGVREENATLRGLLGNSSKDCPYCRLPAAEQARCVHGFPGCSRADDQQLSKHFAAGYALEQAEVQLTELQAKYAVAVEALQGIKRVVCGEARPHWDNSIETTGSRFFLADWCDKALASTPQSILNLLAVLEAVKEETAFLNQFVLTRRQTQINLCEAHRTWTGEGG